MSEGIRDSRGRFPPGQSGNRNGRPKKPRTVSEAIITAMNKTVAANENGRKRRIRKLDAAATQIANKGASGDLRAGKMLLDMAAQAEARDAGVEAPETFTVSDQEIFDQFLADYRKHLEEATNEAGNISDF
jgi:replication-associated recombination protein RarA